MAKLSFPPKLYGIIFFCKHLVEAPAGKCVLVDPPGRVLVHTGDLVAARSREGPSRTVSPAIIANLIKYN